MVETPTIIATFWNGKLRAIVGFSIAFHFVLVSLHGLINAYLGKSRSSVKIIYVLDYSIRLPELQYVTAPIAVQCRARNDNKRKWDWSSATTHGSSHPVLQDEDKYKMVSNTLL